MLTTPSPALDPSSPAALPRRKRGGQPGNQNARKHGFYAARQTAFGLETPAPLVRGAEREVNINCLTNPADSLSPVNLKEIKTHLHAVLLRARAFAKLEIESLPARNLEYAAANAMELIIEDFRDNQINRDMDSFLISQGISDLKSLPSFGYFLTDEQWAVLQPYIPCDGKVDRRGRPAADPRPLLDAIFLKLACRAPWELLAGLVPSLPPVITCRRYYRRLFLSGRLATLYMLLYEDLITRGQVSLDQFVCSRSIISILECQYICIGPGIQKTWQIQTALLFLQRAVELLCDIQRRFKRSFLDKYPYRNFHQPAPSYWPALNCSWLSCREPLPQDPGVFLYCSPLDQPCLVHNWLGIR